MTIFRELDRVVLTTHYNNTADLKGLIGVVTGDCDGVWCWGERDVHVSFTDWDDDSICFLDSDLGLIDDSDMLSGGVVKSQSEFVPGTINRCAPLSPEAAELIEYARKRVDSSFKVVGHGEVGEPSNGALLLRLASEIERLTNVEEEENE